MIERPLTFETDKDPAPVQLTAKESKEALKLLRDQMLACGTMLEGLEKGTLETGFKNTLLKVMENYLVDLHQLFKFESVVRKEHEGRIVEIRAANEQNRELRRQLGEKVSAEDVREKLKNMKDAIQQWWKKEGFGYVRETTFHPYVCEVKLSCTMSVHFEETQPDALRAKGYQIADLEKNGNWVLLLNDSNLRILQEAVIKRFPSAKTQSVESRHWGCHHVNEFSFLIHDYEDIAD